jgi:hypothetical protein
MGIFDSTKTRVQPLFDFIACDSAKMSVLFSLFSKNNTEYFDDISECFYGDNEKSIAPSKVLLRWCLDNLDKLSMPKNYGVNITSPSYKKRESLFSNDASTIFEAKRLVCQNILPQKAWYIFEGYTHPDVYFESNNAIYIGEAKRTEDKLTPSTTWLRERDQLIRHIDAVIESRKEIKSFLIVDKPEFYNIDNYNAYAFFENSMPHRDKKTIERAHTSFIGYCTWDDICKKFNIRFPNTIEET